MNLELMKVLFLVTFYALALASNELVKGRGLEGEKLKSSLRELILRKERCDSKVYDILESICATGQDPKGYVPEELFTSDILCSSMANIAEKKGNLAVIKVLFSGRMPDCV